MPECSGLGGPQTHHRRHAAQGLTLPTARMGRWGSTLSRQGFEGAKKGEALGTVLPMPLLCSGPGQLHSGKVLVRPQRPHV